MNMHRRINRTIMRAHRGAALFIAAMTLLSGVGRGAAQTRRTPQQVAQSPATSPQTWQLLSGNTGHPGAVDLGLTYKYAQVPDNPGDEGRRLLDNDRPADDWNNTVGFNGGDKSVEFSWPKPQWLGRVRIRMGHLKPNLPKKVQVSALPGDAKEWVPLGEIVPEQKEGGVWYDLALKELKLVQKVRLDLRLKEWGFYINEVQLWGVPGYVGVAAATQKRGDKLLLANDGAPRATIVIAQNASDKVRSAASVLQSTLYQMSGAGLPIATDDSKPAGALLLVGSGKFTRDMGVQVKQGGYPIAERAVVRRKDLRIALLGNDGGAFEGTRRAVYLFLESLGCGWFAPQAHWTVIPKTPAPAAGLVNIDWKPAFSSRRIWWPWEAGPSPSDAQAWGLAGTPLYHTHIYSSIVPRDEKLFQEHPEYFAMVNGKRQMTQLSFTSPDVIKLAAQAARDFFAPNPDVATFSLSADDAGGFDESPEAQALDVNAGGRTLAFANNVMAQLRQTHPNKKIIFYAYWYTWEAPTRVKAAPGINVMAINNTCQAHSLDDPRCPANKAWKANFAKWQKTGAELSIYEWYIPAFTDPRWTPIPLVPGDVALRDLRFYHKQGIRWMFYESYNGEKISTAPLRWPIYLTVARGMENPSLSFQQIIDPACRKLFGPAAPTMSAFYQELARALEDCPAHGSNWNPPNPRNIYTPAVLKKLRVLLAQAMTQTAGADSTVALRVNDVLAAWIKAEAAIMEFVPQDVYEIRSALGIFRTDREVVDTAYLRDLLGLNHGTPLILIDDKGHKRTLKAGEKLKLSKTKPIRVQ